MRISDWSSDVCSSDLKRAVTDNDAEVRFDPATKPGVSNLLSILAACTGDTPEALAGRYSQYGPLKTDPAAAAIELLRPFQERSSDIAGYLDALHEVLNKVADTTHAVVAITLQPDEGRSGNECVPMDKNR